MLFCSGREFSPHFVEISMSHGYYPHFVDISVFHEYYPQFIDIVRIGHITSYLACNVFHGIPRFVLVVDIIYIGHNTSCLAHNACSIFHIYSSIKSDWYSLLDSVFIYLCH